MLTLKTAQTFDLFLVCNPREETPNIPTCSPVSINKLVFVTVIHVAC